MDKQPDNWDKAEDWGMKNVRPTVDKWYALPGIIKGLIIFGMVCLFPPLAAAVVIWAAYKWLKFASNLDPNSTTSKLIVGAGAMAAIHELKKSRKK